MYVLEQRFGLHIAFEETICLWNDGKWTTNTTPQVLTLDVCLSLAVGETHIIDTTPHSNKMVVLLLRRGLYSVSKSTSLRHVGFCSLRLLLIWYTHPLHTKFCSYRKGFAFWDAPWFCEALALRHCVGKLVSRVPPAQPATSPIACSSSPLSHIAATPVQRCAAPPPPQGQGQGEGQSQGEGQGPGQGLALIDTPLLRHPPCMTRSGCTTLFAEGGSFDTSTLPQFHANAPSKSTAAHT